MSGGIRGVGSTAARLARLPYHRRVCRAEFHFPEPPPVTGKAVTGPSVQEWVERAQGDFLDNLDLDGFYFGDTNWGSHEGRPFYP